MAGWLATLWIAAALLTATSARADIYFWEDTDGVIHFSNQDAPPNASLYMREIVTPDPPETAEVQTEANREALSRELARKQARTQQRLEEANDKLNEALERVDDLTESVSRSRAQAAAAAEAARQAELDAQAARDHQYDNKRRVIVHSVPYRPYDPYRKYDKDRHHYKDRHYKYKKDRKYGKHRIKDRHSLHRKHDKQFSRDSRSKHRIDKYKSRRHNPYKYSIPKPILPPEKHRIPKAYGIR